MFKLNGRIIKKNNLKTLIKNFKKTWYCKVNQQKEIHEKTKQKQAPAPAPAPVPFWGLKN